MNDGLKLFFLFVLLCGTATGLVLTFQYKMQPSFAGWAFCKDMGYNYDGHYLDYKHGNYGAIECSKCFADGCEKESFDVKKDWRGELSKHDVVHAVSETEEKA